MATTLWQRKVIMSQLVASHGRTRFLKQAAITTLLLIGLGLAATAWAQGGGVYFWIHFQQAPPNKNYRVVVDKLVFGNPNTWVLVGSDDMDETDNGDGTSQYYGQVNVTPGPPPVPHRGYVIDMNTGQLVYGPTYFTP